MKVTALKKIIRRCFGAFGDHSLEEQEANSREGHVLYDLVVPLIEMLRHWFICLFFLSGGGGDDQVFGEPSPKRKSFPSIYVIWATLTYYHIYDLWGECT